MEEFGEVYFLNELNSRDDLHGKYVRVIGEYSFCDPASCLCFVSYGGHGVLIDSELSGVKKLSEFCLCEVIGEAKILQPHEQVAYKCKFIIRAKIARNVDGLDMKLYEQSVLSQRKFLKSLISAEAKIS